jgi:hypothetical protein
MPTRGQAINLYNLFKKELRNQAKFINISKGVKPYSKPSTYVMLSHEVLEGH